METETSGGSCLNCHNNLQNNWSKTRPEMRKIHICVYVDVCVGKAKNGWSIILYNQYPKQVATGSLVSVANYLVRQPLCLRGLRLGPSPNGLPCQISQ